MAIHVYKNIFWLDIAVDYITFVQIAEAKEYLAEVELGQLFRELALLEQVGEKLTAGADVHDEEELFGALKRPVKLDQKGVIELLEDFSFAQDRLDLILGENLIFAQNLDRVKPPRVFLSRQDHATESSAADHPDLFEVIDRDLSLRC